MVADLIEKVSEEGLTVKYPTGYRQSLESATMTIVRTGIAQAACDVSEARMEEMDWDIILVSAHVGARTGDGGQNPGKSSLVARTILFPNRKNKKIPEFLRGDRIRHRRGTGRLELRHSFGSGDGKNNPFDAKNISYADNRKVEEAQKRQRLLERRIRNSKRQIQTLQFAIDTQATMRRKANCKVEQSKKLICLVSKIKHIASFAKTTTCALMMSD